MFMKCYVPMEVRMFAVKLSLLILLSFFENRVITIILLGQTFFFQIENKQCEKFIQMIMC